MSSSYQLLNFHFTRESFEACFHKSVRPLLIVSAFMIVFTAGLCRIGGFIGCSFIMERNMVDDYCLFGHVFANFSAAGVTECYKTCQTNCRCISFNFLKNINQTNCQLNEENRHTKPGALKPMSGSQYYELVTNYKVTVRHKIFRHHSPLPPPPHIKSYNVLTLYMRGANKYKKTTIIYIGARRA